MDLCYVIPESIIDAEHILFPGMGGFRCVEANNAFGVEMYSGGFCQSYPIYKGGIKKCLRLWHDDDARKMFIDHIISISDYFSKHNVKYTIQFKYDKRALLLSDNSVIPGVVMDWINGLRLIDYVRKNYRNSYLIRKITDSFYDMVKYMNDNGYAHGDLSGDNIIVKDSGQLCLVDYDTFYIEGYTKKVKPSTAGLPCYQHPNRNKLPFISKTMDYYSQQVIYLSLLVIAEAPYLFNEDFERGLLFQDEDMLSAERFKRSEIHKKVDAINNTEICNRLKELDSAISGDLSQVRSIVDLRISSNTPTQKNDKSKGEIHFSGSGTQTVKKIYNGSNIIKSPTDINVSIRGKLFNIEVKDGDYKLFDICGKTKKANGRAVRERGDNLFDGDIFIVDNVSCTIRIPE